MVDSIGFDVHAIAELQSKGLPSTDDSPKYLYKALDETKDASYGKNYY